MLRLRLRRTLENLHLFYLGILPALATFAVLAVYGTPSAGLLFLGGTVAVSVYLAVVISYTRPVQSLGLALFVLLDGPLWVLVSRSTESTKLLSFAIDGFLVDGVAIWLAIVWLALTTSRPTREQRIATVGLTLVAVGSILFTLRPYLQEQVLSQGLRLLGLLLGMIEAVIARQYLLEADEVVRDETTGGAYIVVLLFLWIVALSAGNIIHQNQ
jgi:hypothetical protein